MANSNKPFGLKPLRLLSGAPYNGQVNAYCFLAADATATFIGDLVKLSGSADSITGYPSIAQVAATDTSVGVLVALEPDPTDLSLNYRKASTRRIAYVADDPALVFAIQEDSVGAALAITEVGLCTDIAAVGSGSTVTGLSAMVLDSSDTATAAGQLRIMRLAQTPGNIIGNYAVWEVLIAEHSYSGGTAVDV